MLGIVHRLIGRPWIPGYKVGDEIFAGGFGKIYRAVQKKNNVVVALKVLNEEGVKIAQILNKDKKARWEAEIIASLNHPNIIRCYEYGCLKHYYWMALEFVESSLTDFIGACRNADEERMMIPLFEQLLSAVAYIHQKGYIHRDLCLSNILITRQRQLKVIDFGLTVPIDSSLTQGKAGTPSYMAPELIRSSRHSIQSDIYSLGVMMYEMVTGTKPFKGDDPQAKMVRSLNVRPPRPSSIEGVHISPELEALILRAMEKEPKDRFPSVKDMENALIIIRHKHKL